MLNLVVVVGCVVMEAFYELAGSFPWFGFLELGFGGVGVCAGA